MTMASPLIQEHETEPRAGVPALVGTSLCIRQLRHEIARIARTECTVLITGETGTGKGHVARLLHELSGRSPFMHVDCASLAESIIESELFGHERGSFTGAHDRRMGRFELAGRGTIFLDEIGELDPRLQAKLLRVLQDREFERIGGSRTLPMHARVVSATNQDLSRAVRTRAFRADLYYRLKVVELCVPPLRSRMEDVLLLAEHGLREGARRLGLPVPEVDEDFVASLMSYAWPGNVRELFNVIEAVLVLCDGERLRPAHFRHVIDSSAEFGAVSTGALDERTLRLADLAAGEPMEEGRSESPRRIAHALVDTGGNVARAARRLKIARSTLRYQIRKYGLATMIPRD